MGYKENRKERIHNALVIRAQCWLDDHIGKNIAIAQKGYLYGDFGGIAGETVDIFRNEKNPFKRKKYVEINAEKLYDNFENIMQRRTKWLK